MINKKNNKQNIDDTINPDRYLITYADLITLLLGLFVILYASSQVNEEKYKEFSNAFSDFFKPTQAKAANTGNGIMVGRKNSIPEPIFPSIQNKTLEEIKAETEISMSKFIKQGLINIKSNSTVLTLTLSESLLFQSGKADIQRDGLIVLDSISAIIRSINKSITIDGHTDSHPIRTFRYESNWHLSSARALAVGYMLITKGLDEKNLTFRCFGAMKPVSENSTPEGRSKNRRVEITISDLPPEKVANEVIK